MYNSITIHYSYLSLILFIGSKITLSEEQVFHAILIMIVTLGDKGSTSTRT